MVIKIGITGGKGGTGKSTVATALAYQLSKTNRVLLVDADVDCPNDHLILGAELRKIRDVEQRMPVFNYDKCARCGRCGNVCRSNAIASVSGTEPIFFKEKCNGCGSCVFECPVGAIGWGKKTIGSILEGKKDNLDILSGDLKSNEQISEFVVTGLKKEMDKRIFSRRKKDTRDTEDVRDAEDTEKENYDIIIIDTAAGTHCPVIAALEICDHILAVTEPTPLGEHDLGIMLELLGLLDKKAEIVINRSDIGDKDLIKKMSEKRGFEVTHEIPYSDEIVQDYSHATPIRSRQIDQIAENIKNRFLDGSENGNDNGGSI